MASSKEYLDFILEQLSELEGISYRAMMGEYILYYGGKIVGGIYDDRFLVKVTKSSRKKDKDASAGAPTAPATGVSVTGSQTSNFGRVNAPTLEEVMRKGQEIFHITDKSYRLEANVINVYAYSDVTYVVISIENKSDIGYEAGDAQFTVENRRNRKQLATDKSVWPKSSYGSLSCAPNSRTMVGYTLPKQTLQKNEVLKIYIYEKGGTRNLFLTLSDKDVNYAVSPI